MFKPFNSEKFKEKAVTTHNDKYDYSLVKDAEKSAYLKIEIICREHGVFVQEAGYHLRGSGCPQCSRARVNSSISKAFNADDFIAKAKAIHGSIYDYSRVVNESKSSHLKVTLGCSLHGLFSVAVKDHLGKRGGRCPRCSKKESYGEFLIRKALEDFQIEFELQKKFDSLRDPVTNRLLSYDFYLPKFNLLIEFDGEYHFHPPNFKKLEKEQLEKVRDQIRMRDLLKDQFAKDNTIQLLRVHYSNRNPTDIKRLINESVNKCTGPEEAHKENKNENSNHRRRHWINRATTWTARNRTEG
jgi:hypothetical protein